MTGAIYSDQLISAAENLKQAGAHNGGGWGITLPLGFHS